MRAPLLSRSEQAGRVRAPEAHFGLCGFLTERSLGASIVAPSGLCLGQSEPELTAKAHVGASHGMRTSVCGRATPHSPRWLNQSGSLCIAFMVRVVDHDVPIPTSKPETDLPHGVRNWGRTKATGPTKMGASEIPQQSQDEPNDTQRVVHL